MMRKHFRPATESLIERSFLTWKYGPAVRHLYDHIKRYGNGLVPVKAFDDIQSIMDEKTQKELEPEFESAVDVIKRTYKRFGGYSAYKLVSISHWEGGAWAVTKKEGKTEKISNTAIWNEFNGRYNQ